DPETAFDFTARGNLVAVVTNGTAVLGLGNIGPLAGKPVMEGKGVLFKRFADIDVFDIELASEDPEDIIKACQLLEPTFGGINLEDIKAPECFYIERVLRETMQIPVFHDDQHGTAIISGAALLNAAELTGRKLADMRVVVSGAGASGVACARHYINLGIRPENILMLDSKGVLFQGRTEGMNPIKQEFARPTEARTLEEALRGADLFLGLSVKGALDPRWLKGMADQPIIFALANPDPEITYPDALAARDDVIIATGRSDYPNQINNVLGFPFIFRGALDCRATTINEEMKMAATRALAALAKQDVPDSVSKAYGDADFHFGREYLIPKPFDSRVLLWEARAVAEAAMKTGVARRQLDLDEYRDHLEGMLGKTRGVMRSIMNKARTRPKRIVYPEGENPRILRATSMVREEGMATPVLLGRPDTIRETFRRLELDPGDSVLLDPESSDRMDGYVQEYYRLRQRKGLTLDGARSAMRNPIHFGAMMVRMGDADGMICGLSHRIPETLRPALEIVGMRPGVSRVSGVHVMMAQERMLFFADTTVNIRPTGPELAEIARETARTAREFGVVPRVAFVSFSSFGSAHGPGIAEIREALRILAVEEPDLVVDGEMHADVAVTPGMIDRHFPFSRLTRLPANVLIFPVLEASNAAYKLLQRLGGAEQIGPILQGIHKPVHLLQPQSEMQDVLNMTAIAVVEAGAGNGRD
ncbi:MAG: NADP-dependent malic enzyme, partial [Candidatus Eisenbacteria bacterium]|nr:NADP-dependent malic enzyme [Candidatus Eisenbacteria bacterium]